MMMTTTTVTTTTTMSTSSAFTSRSVSLNSVLDLYQSFAEGKDKSLSSQELLAESQENITIQAEVYSSPRKSLRTAQSAISTSDHILSQTISACSAASNDPEAIEFALEPLLASPRSQQDATLSADTCSSDTPELVIGNRDSSLTEFLYPNVEFVHAFPAVTIEPIPDNGVLMLDVIQLMPRSNIFCVSSSPKKCVVCTKEMTVHFSYQSRGMSYIYDLEKGKKIVQPYIINDTFELAHNDCMGERTNEGRNNLFRIFEEQYYFSQKWRNIEWPSLIKIIFYSMILSVVMSITIYLSIDKAIKTEILSTLWIVVIIFTIINIYLFKVWGMSFIEYCRQWRKDDRQLKLVIWKPSSIPTVKPFIISTRVNIV